jgi:hypothetical protein
MPHSFNLHTVGSNLANCLEIGLGRLCELIVLAARNNWSTSVVGGRGISDGLLAWRISSGRRSAIAGGIVRGWDFGLAIVGLLRREGEIGSGAKPDAAIALDGSKN